jgi:hypothetical protein
MANIYHKEPLYEKLKSIFIQSIIDINQSQLDKYYEYWLQSFNEEKSNKFVISRDLIHKKQQIPEEAILSGIDLPAWFGDFKNKKIVVLGIDPLRSYKVFEEAKADIKRDVILGTPYAFHEKLSRDKDCKSYWTLVEGLVNSNNFVYCTDIFKTYYFKEREKMRSYNDPEYTKNFNHLEILKQELELVQPDIIIAFGQLAHQFLLNKKSPKISQSILNTKAVYKLNNKPVDVYTVLHLSKTPRGKNFRTFLENNRIDTSSLDVENRVQCAEKYLEIFRQYKII